MVAINLQLFQTKIEPHLVALLAYCKKLTANQADSEDLFQTTLEKIFRTYCDGMELQKALLFRVAKNAWIDAHRKRVVTQEPLKENQDAASTVVDIREAFELLAERLTARQAMLILMVDMFGFTAKETASHIQSTEGAVKEALKRARARLRRFSGDQENHDRLAKPGERMSRELMEIFIQAFRSGNIDRIYNAYRELRISEMNVTVISGGNGYYYFDLSDPNGHLLRVIS